MHSSIIRAIEVADFSIVIRRKGGIEMNYNEFLSSLNVTQRKALLKRRDAKGLWHLAGHRGAFVLCAVLIFLAVPLSRGATLAGDVASSWNPSRVFVHAAA